MKTNSWFVRNIYAISDWISQAYNHGKCDNNGKVGYFRFDDDNNMNYRYILSVTYKEMGQLSTYNPIYYNENKR